MLWKKYLCEKRCYVNTEKQMQYSFCRCQEYRELTAWSQLFPWAPIIYIQCLTHLISHLNLPWPKQSYWFPTTPQSGPLQDFPMSKQHHHLLSCSRKKKKEILAISQQIWPSNVNFTFMIHTTFNHWLCIPLKSRLYLLPLLNCSVKFCPCFSLTSVKFILYIQASHLIKKCESTHVSPLLRILQ